MTASTETDRVSRQKHTDCVYAARAVDCPTCQAATGQRAHQAAGARHTSRTAHDRKSPTSVSCGSDERQRDQEHRMTKPTERTAP